MGKGGRLDGRGHWVRVERGPALARVAATLLVVIAAYVAGAAQTAAIRWIALALTLLGIIQLGLLLRQLIHREGRRAIERHELLQQLEVGNVRLSVALRAARMGTWTWNADTDEFDLDAFEARLFGLVEGRHHVKDLLAGNNIHPDDLEIVRDAARRALREGVAVGYEFRIPDKQKGGWRWSEGSTIRYSEPGKPTLLIGVNRDITERKLQELELSKAKQRAECALAELAKSRAELDLALESGQLGVWRSEVRGPVVSLASYAEQMDSEIDTDANARRIWGLPLDERITRRKFAETLVPAERERIVTGVVEAFARGSGGYADHYQIIRGDGEVRTLAVRGALTTRVDAATGEEVRSITGVVRDVTDEENLKADLRQKVHEAQLASSELEQSRAELELALRSGRLGVWHSEVPGADHVEQPDRMGLDQPVYWDINTRRIFGRDPDEPVTRRHYFEALHPEDRERVLAGLADSRGGEYADQYRIVRPDGEVRTIAVHGAAPATRIDPNTGEPGYSMTGIVRDITDEENLKADLRQKVSEAQLATSELEQARTDLELALRSGRLGAWRSEFRDVSEADHPDDPGLDDTIVWDANVRRIYGYGATERVTRRHFFNALHPEDRERVLAKLAEIAEAGCDYTDQYRIVRPDGDVRWVAVDATFVSRKDPDAGESRWMTGIARDITEEENLKADLRQKALEAQLATEAKARFLAMMSHEIRTPMNGVVGMIELLLDTPLSVDQKQMLKTCKDSAFVLLTVINDILDFSKIEAGKLELDYTRLSTRRLVEGVGEALSAHATQRGLDLDVEIAADVPRRVVGDRVRLRQILTNLVGNAIKFTEQGGVVVTVSMEPGDYGARGGDGHVDIRFDVVDSGIGMDEDAVRNLFQAFHQADIATTRRFGGTGLGLSIVKRLTELMGGRVECESRLQQGSRFSVVIPFEVATAGERDWGYPITGVRVLASVAQERRRRIVSDFLSQLDASIEFCDSGDALLARARETMAEGAVDLVLLDKDWSISGCAGLHRRFSEIPELSHLPFVVVRSNELVQAQLIPNVTLVNGNPLTRTSLVHGMAVALGRISPPVPAIAGDGGTDPAQPLSRDREEAAGRLILLAEDNPTNREVIARQLARLGYACDVAEDGARAWTMLTSGAARYALLLTDCHMPRLDGYALTRRIRDHERSNGGEMLPIVAITANALQGEGERCLALGMNGYLAKPLQIRELRQLLAEFLPPVPDGHDAEQPAVDDLSSADGTGLYHELLEILGGDDGKLRHVLGVFERSTRQDCEQLDAAQTAGDWRRVRELAHKLRSGCRQLGEDAAALALETVEKDAGSDTDMEEQFAVARRELDQVLMRVGTYLTNGGAR